MFKYCIINNICLDTVPWSIFHVYYSLCSTSWISSKAFPSPFLPQWQSPEGDGRPETPHPQERSKMLPQVSPGDSGEEATRRRLRGRKWWVILLKLHLVPEDRGRSPGLLTIFCGSMASSRSPPSFLPHLFLFICPASGIHWASIMCQALCQMRGMETKEKKSSSSSVNCPILPGRPTRPLWRAQWSREGQGRLLFVF